MKLRKKNPLVVGLVGLVTAGLLLAVCFNISAVRSLLGAESFKAELSDSGGLRTGDDVRVRGINVGTITSIKLSKGLVAVEFRASDLRVGLKTTARVKSDNALGKKFLEITPNGGGDLDHIALERTHPGYAVTEVLGDLSTQVQKIDVKQLAKAMSSLSSTLSGSSEEFAEALTGVAALSDTVASRDQQIARLLDGVTDLSGTLADRNEQITELMARGARITEEIQARRQQVSGVLGALTRATKELEGFAKDNPGLDKDLEKIKHIADVLGENRENLSKTLQYTTIYIRSLGEAISSGPFFQANVPNLTSPQTLLAIDNIVEDVLGQNPAGER